MRRTLLDTTEHKQVEELGSVTRLVNRGPRGNNSLTIIVGRPVMLAEDPSLVAQTRARITQARAAERLRQIVVEMQQLTRVYTSTPRPSCPARSTLGDQWSDLTRLRLRVEFGSRSRPLHVG
jgi:hypothetical protein